MTHIKLLLFSALIGTIFSVLTYLFTDRLGEWKKRKNTSLLGEIILEGLQEEIRTGINIMQALQLWAHKTNSTALSPSLLPTASWSGMATISDDIMLRIATTSQQSMAIKLRYDCKNYFIHICGNINYIISNNHNLAPRVEENILKYLSYDDKGNYLVASQNLYNDLEIIKNALKTNAKKHFPA